MQIIYDASPNGSGEPVDNYKYATDSSVVLGAPPATVDKGYAFIGWSVTGKKYYTNNTFDITEDIIESYNPSTKTGKITVKAIYQKLGTGALTPTTITYDPNGGTGSAVTVDTGKHGDHTFTAQWEKVQEPEDETTPDKTTPSDNTPKGGNGVKTVDTNNIVLFIMLAAVSLAVIILALKKLLGQNR